MRATVKWYSAAKGFGWVILETGEEVYLHFSALPAGADLQLASGAPLELDVIEGPSGKQAVRARPPEGRR